MSKFDDQGVAIAKFSEEQGPIAIQSDRTALVTLIAKEGQEAPKSFAFGKPLVEGAENTYQRFVDADMVAVGPSIDLERAYGKKSNATTIWLVGSVLASVLTLGLILFLIRRGAPQQVADNGMPVQLTAFTVHQYLHGLRQRNHLPPAKQQQLDVELARLEETYFAADRAAAEPQQLRQLLTKWSTAR